MILNIGIIIVILISYHINLTMKYIVRDHQFQALSNLANYYYNDTYRNNRGILSMACGSGKTFVFYNLVKLCNKLSFNEPVEKYTHRDTCVTKSIFNCSIKLDSICTENCFIFVTSRVELVRSTIQDLVKWSVSDNIKINIIYKVTEINNTQLKKSFHNENIYDSYINNYVFNLNGATGKEGEFIYSKIQELTIIITTYNSIGNIIDHITANNTNTNNYIHVDWLILDEAHNVCSSNKTNNIKNILEIEESSKFVPQRFLFITATPLKIINKNKESQYVNMDIEYSMDNTDLYGDIFYEYKFHQAIKDKMIVNFTVVCLDDLGIDEDISTYTDKLKSSRSCRDVESDLLKIQHTYFESICLFLSKVIDKYKLHHVLVYINSVDRLNIMYEKLRNYDNIEAFKFYSYEGKDRKQIDKFKTNNMMGKSHVLLTVDTFNEGIDIPICDSILFAEERFSETQIVQNIGRCLRNYPGKENAYVIIPTKLYNVNILGVQNSYSSKYQTTRNVIDLLKGNINEQGDTSYCNRLTNGRKTLIGNTNENPLATGQELLDKIIPIILEHSPNNIDTSKLEIVNKPVNSHVINTINNMSILDETGRVSNLTLLEVKNMLREKNINNMNLLGDLLNKSEGVILKEIIDSYRKNKIVDANQPWINYSDLLSGDILSFDESKNILHNLKLREIHTNQMFSFIFQGDFIFISNVLDYCKFMNKLFEYRLYKRDNLELNNIVDILIKIPNDPKQYYMSDWEYYEMTWDKFLDIYINESSQTGTIITNPISSYSTNTYTNMNNIINNDKELVNIVNNSGWVSLPSLNINFNIITDYLRFEFGHSFYINGIRFLFPGRNMSRKRECLSINCYIQDTNSVPVRIVNEYKIKFDPIIRTVNKSFIAHTFNSTLTEAIFINPHHTRVRGVIDHINNLIDNYIIDTRSRLGRI
jgi:superfamily II DNA or RNA helicase